MTAEDENLGAPEPREGEPIAVAPTPLSGVAEAVSTPPTRRRSGSVRFQLESVVAENLRAYKRAELPLSTLTVVVGNNNAGKSSMLRLLDWVLNEADEVVLTGGRQISPEERQLLLPATLVKGGARRLTLSVRFDDARRGKRYGQDGTVPASLRISVSKSSGLIRMNVGPARRDEKNDRRAVELWRLLKDYVQFVLVPSTRDARSDRFRGAFEGRLKKLLLDRFEHSKRAGAPTEYRRAKKFLTDLGKMVGEAQKELVTELRRHLPLALLDDARLNLSAEPEDLADWIRERIELTLCTGQQDTGFVAPEEVGNGLQSVLDVALALASLDIQGTRYQVIAAIEEPEAFLHPSGQRRLATTLRKFADEDRCSIILTTHSPYFVDEARYGEVVLARGHRFYVPKTLEGDRRSQINTALMTTHSAEVFFARGVLLVEGPGDVALFEGLLRRIQAQLQVPEFAELVAIEVGGKRSFAPWWRLLQSYGTLGDRPVEWVSVFDGDAASKDGNDRALLRAADDAKLGFDDETKSAIVKFGDLDYSNVTAREVLAREVNQKLQRHGVFLFSIDCEWAAMGHLATSHAGLVSEILQCEPPEKDVEIALARRAGSKVRDGKTSPDARKQPFVRRRLAEKCPLDSIPPEVEDVLRMWFSTVLAPAEAARRLQMLKLAAPRAGELNTSNASNRSTEEKFRRR